VADGENAHGVTLGRARQAVRNVVGFQLGVTRS
jgi:hypothetical protein